MKYKFIKLVSIASCMLVGCKNKDNQPSEPVEDLTTDYVIDAELCDTMETLEDKSVYNIRLNYTDKYFKYTASTFKKDLMLLSFGATNAAVEKEEGQDFFSRIGFTPVYVSPDYDTIGTKDSVQYIIAKKVIDNFSIFAVSFKGHRYGQEWGNNFDLGESGNHAGFMEAATKVYNNLLTYISNEHNYKLWFSGYSRGGALSNVLSYLVMNNASLGINETNLYTYTFAATRALTRENAKPYKNVFNLFNSADILSNFVPEKFGLYRCGVDIDIFDEHLDDYTSSFSEEMVLPNFTKSKNYYQNDKEFTLYFLGQLLNEDEEVFPKDKYPHDLNTREHYYEVQNDFSYLLSHVLGIPYYITILSEEFEGITKSEIVSYVSDNGENLFNKFSEIFDKQGVTYEDDMLLQSCSTIVSLLNRYLGLIVSCMANSNVSRMISMHYTETIFILTKRI